ncbi:hypothetical protein K438DRAFT_1791473 [Mycena galopus ATCC 62051]|nr:hypothetical protein K438DRAFT_1791473 [Mycena galopus ATCC 62051]
MDLSKQSQGADTAEISPRKDRRGKKRRLNNSVDEPSSCLLPSVLVHGNVIGGRRNLAEDAAAMAVASIKTDSRYLERPSASLNRSSSEALTVVHFIATDKSVRPGQKGLTLASGTFYPAVPVASTGSQGNPKPVPLGLYQTQRLQKSAARKDKPHNGGDKSSKDQSQSGSKGAN